MFCQEDLATVAEETVITNGSNGATKDDNFLSPDYNSTEEGIPRRSSLIKDSSRRQQRKKTVSFSSMPGEKVVVNGMLNTAF